MLNGKRILVAPLDWGTGHAARCVPVIRRLMDLKALPVIGADSGPRALLRMEFPELEHVKIPGREVRYSAGKSQVWSMIRQFPALLRSMDKEHEQFEKLKGPLALDAVISDQRFGIRSSTIPSVLITHQVFPFAPFAQSVLRKINARNIARFDRCWIMDNLGTQGLAGGLSHGNDLPSNARYIGVQSRMQTIGVNERAASNKRYRIVAVISGPEPQRSILEDRLMEQMQGVDGEHLIVQGKPERSGSDQKKNVTRIAHLPGAELKEVMLGSEMIVSRSGYTTLMDLAALHRPALIIPTPGQPEQEYLADLHRNTGQFIVQKQEELDLAMALRKIGALSLGPFRVHQDLLGEALQDLASMLQ